MKKILTLSLIILCSFLAFSQNIYQWNSEKITISSPVKLQENSSSSGSGLMLEGNGFNIEISKLEGMEGISGLEGSLESYASSFYKGVGKVQTLNELKNLKAATIEAQKDGKPVVLCMFSTVDYTKHYICEISFTENQRKNAISMIKNISYNEKVSNVSNENIVDSPSEITNNNNNVINKNQTGKIQKGLLAPDFKLKNVNGGSTSLSSLKGKTLLLDFWGTWCKPCIQLIPKLKEIYSKYSSKNFELVSIANDNDAEKWKNMITTKGMSWTNLIDLDESVTKLYKINAFPTLILVDENGVIVEVGASESQVEEYLKNLGSKNNSDPKTSENTHNSGTALEKATWDLLSKYCPDGYTILDEYYKSPSSYQGQSVSGDSDFTKWIDGTSENDVIKSLNTVVHEMCHGYTGRLYLKGLQDAGLSIDGDYSAFYLGNKEMKLVKHTKVFVTKEINSIYPEKLKTSRYETYVYPSEAIMGSQQSGIYGLLDELNAYYQGTKTSLDLYDYYLENHNNVNGWLQFFSDFYGTYYAYLEFKSYMIFYMIYAEKNYKDIYSQTLANKDFIYAFRKTDENWRKLITDFIGLKKKIIDNLSQQGMETVESNEFITINGQGVGNFADKYNLFQAELKDAKFQKIAEALGLNTAFGPELGL